MISTDQGDSTVLELLCLCGGQGTHGVVWQRVGVVGMSFVEMSFVERKSRLVLNEFASV